MTNPLAILQNTPPWVFVLGIVLATFGVQALKPRGIAVARLLIVPLVFMAWGLISLVIRASDTPLLAVVWLACGAAGLAIGWCVTTLHGVLIDRAARRVSVPGSAVPLVRNLSIFVVKYALGAAMAMAPAWHVNIAFCDVGVSGLTTGYFAAWLLRLALLYRAASPVLTAS
jgi:hypothetical protein